MGIQFQDENGMRNWSAPQNGVSPYSQKKTLSQSLIRHSGGLIRTESQAGILLLTFIILAILFSVIFINVSEPQQEVVKPAFFRSSILFV